MSKEVRKQMGSLVMPVYTGAYIWLESNKCLENKCRAYCGTFWHYHTLVKVGNILEIIIQYANSCLNIGALK